MMVLGIMTVSVKIGKIVKINVRIPFSEVSLEFIVLEEFVKKVEPRKHYLKLIGATIT